MSHPEEGLSSPSCLDIPYEQDPGQIRGLVAEGSTGCWGDLEDGYVVRHFTLSPWQPVDGEPESEKLLVLQKVPYDGTPDETGEDGWFDTFWEESTELIERTITVWISSERDRAVMISEP